jgi:hypothetical protein
LSESRTGGNVAGIEVNDDPVVAGRKRGVAFAVYQPVFPDEHRFRQRLHQHFVVMEMVEQESHQPVAEVMQHRTAVLVLIAGAFSALIRFCRLAADPAGEFEQVRYRQVVAVRFYRDGIGLPWIWFHRMLHFRIRGRVRRRQIADSGRAVMD